jgi:hypothetical protein
MNFYELNNLLFESMDVRIKDAHYESPMKTVGDLAWHLMIKLSKVIESMKPDQVKDYYKSKAPDLVAVDGPGIGGEDSYFTNNGTINIYLKGIPTEYHQKIKDAALYFIKDANVEYGTVITNSSNAYGGDTIRIKINKMPESDNNPPELNMSNGNTDHIFSKVLNLDQYNRGSGYLIPARELLIKIDTYNDNLSDMDARLPTVSKGSGGATFISYGLDADQINQRLEKIRSIAMWAIENDYDTIQVF